MLGEKVADEVLDSSQSSDSSVEASLLSNDTNAFVDGNGHPRDSGGTRVLLIAWTG